MNKEEKMSEITRGETLEIIDCAFEYGGNACDFPEHCKAQLGSFACAKAYKTIRCIIEKHFERKEQGGKDE